MHKYRLVAKKGEGTFSEVLKAQCIKNGKYVAIKCMKNHFDSLDQELREAEKRQKALMTPDANPTGGIGSTMPGIVASGSLHQELDSKLIRHQGTFRSFTPIGAYAWFKGVDLSA
ncbi:protein kinase domain-containing protein [Haematococcus lacustris]|uniref:Protein kinase domain-containing protein n=1 Tax=Haematococcus lacustris TaxID=44745 RepID=A0A6A0A976_HAELA|nr:protein kinase domain-containing protein [Haematococcus lacustris]